MSAGRDVPLGAEFLHGYGAVPLRELLPVRPEHVGDMRVCRHRALQRLEDLDLLRRVGNVVFAADHVRDARLGIVEGGSEVVRRATVGAQEHEILELLVREFDPPLDRVLPDGRSLVGHAEAHGPIVLVRASVGHQPAGGLRVARERVELELHVAVPVEPEPPQRALDLLDGLRHLAARVGVLDPEQELALLVSRKEPVEERSANTSDVEEAGRAGCKPDADGHAVIVVPCSPAPTSPPLGGSTPPSSARSSVAPRPFRSSRRARALGGRRTTHPRTSSASSEARAEAGIGAVVCHAALPHQPRDSGREIRKKSRAALLQTVEVACAIEADGVVLHVGSHLGAGLRRRPRAGGPRARDSAGHVQRRHVDPARELGRRGRHDRPLGGRARRSLRPPRPPPAARALPRLLPPLGLGCRRHRSGGLRRDARRRSTSGIGLDRLRCLHVNDAAAELGLEPRPPRKRPGRGDGEGLGVFLAHPRVQGLPAILETPGPDNHGPDAAEVQRLKDLHATGDGSYAAWSVCSTTRKDGVPWGSSKNSGLTHPRSSARCCVAARDLGAAHRKRLADRPHRSEAALASSRLIEELEVDLDRVDLLHAADVRASPLLVGVEEGARAVDACGRDRRPCRSEPGTAGTRSPPAVGGQLGPGEHLACHRLSLDC